MDQKIKDFHDYIMHDIMRDIPDITSKRMFGGYGIYKRGIIFAIIASSSEIYFKIDESLKEKFKKHGSHPFVYTGHKTKKPTEMPYWILPEEIMEDKEELSRWIDASANVKKSK